MIGPRLGRLTAASLLVAVLVGGDPAQGAEASAGSSASVQLPVAGASTAPTGSASAAAATAPDAATVAGTAPQAPSAAALRRERAGSLTPLVPEIAGAPFQLAPGPRQFLRRLSFSPGVGWLGDGRLYLFRLGFNPNRWLGYEASLGHTPGDAVHAVVHGLSVQLRAPLPYRVQPYATLGYGMMLVFPGRLVNADAVTRNTVSFGGGLELYVRDDVALRGEVRHRSVIGRDRHTTDNVVFDYREATVGLTFYRALGHKSPAPTTTPGGLEP